MKYNVGDKVLIKDIDWYNENKDEYGYVRCIDFLFTPEHSKYCGCEFTISHITEFRIPSYVMENNGHEWTDEMIEGLVEDEGANYSKVIDDGVSSPIIVKTSSATIDTDKGFYSYSSDGNLEMEWNLPKGYQFTDENGNVINATKIILEKKKKEYPKTYEECYQVTGLSKTSDIYGYKNGLLFEFQKLLIARDAYWKIAGEEMGLGKPWEPDWSDYENIKYIIGGYDGEIGYDQNHHIHKILAFPTAEMRDAFKENFDPDIEICKEFL